MHKRKSSKLPKEQTLSFRREKKRKEKQRVQKVRAPIQHTIILLSPTTKKNLASFTQKKSRKKEKKRKNAKTRSEVNHIVTRAKMLDVSRSTRFKQARHERPQRKKRVWNLENIETIFQEQDQSKRFRGEPLFKVPPALESSETEQHNHMLHVRLPNGLTACMRSQANPKESFKDYCTRILGMAKAILELNGYDARGISLSSTTNEFVDLEHEKSNILVEDVLGHGDVLTVHPSGYGPNMSDVQPPCAITSPVRSNIDHLSFESKGREVTPLTTEPEYTFVMFERTPERVVVTDTFFEFRARLCCIKEYFNGRVSTLSNCYSSSFSQPRGLYNNNGNNSRFGNAQFTSNIAGMFSPSAPAIRSMMPAAGERVYTSLKSEEELTRDMICETRTRNPNNPRCVRHPYKEEVSCLVLKSEDHQELDKSLYAVKAELLYTGEIVFRVRVTASSFSVKSDFYVVVYIGEYCSRSHAFRCITRTCKRQQMRADYLRKHGGYFPTMDTGSVFDYANGQALSRPMTVVR